jgi:sialate O-acetylesterase
MPRRYKIPASLNKSDKNTITVRVFDHWRGGGFTGEPAVLTLELASEASSQSIPLSGTWSYNVECAFEPIVGANPPPPPLAAGTSGSPATLFNAMIHPLLNYSIHGVIWYQGESNVSRAFQYRTLLPGMIRDWRNRWNQGDFPILIVQLANLGPPDTIPVESDWAELREAQLLTSVNVPNCGLAVTIDIGEADDIHPKNKQEVGKRLASLALAELDASVQPRRPDYTALVVEGSRIRLDFDTKGRGLTSRDGRPLASFTIAGDDQKFIRASATIDGGSVWVWSDQVARPVAVRYGWSNNPDCTLCDESGIPISPFRTDTWKGITQDQ